MNRMIANRTANLQFIRILLICGIICAHCGAPILGEGGNGVSFFFIISGFLYKPIDLHTYVDYVKKKFFKIIPFYWLCMILSIVLLKKKIEGGVILHVLLLQSWIPVKNDFFFWYVGVAWFLSSLMFCYLIFPFIERILKEEFIYYYIIVVVVLIALIFFIDFGEYNTWTKYVNPLYRLLEYTLGYIIMLFCMNKSKKNVSFVLYLLFFSLYVVSLHYCKEDFLLPFIHAFIIMFVVLFDNKTISKYMGSEIVLRVAKYGLYLYLSHQIFEFLLIDKGLLSRQLIFACIVLSFGLGICFEAIQKKIYMKMR